MVFFTRNGRFLMRLEEQAITTVCCARDFVSNMIHVNVWICQNPVEMSLFCLKMYVLTWGIIRILTFQHLQRILSVYYIERVFKLECVCDSPVTMLVYIYKLLIANYFRKK